MTHDERGLITTRRIGPLTITRCPERDGTTTTYLDWHRYDDPRHRRLTYGKAPVWLPLSVRNSPTTKRIALPFGREIARDTRKTRP